MIKIELKDVEKIIQLSNSGFSDADIVRVMGKLWRATHHDK